MTRSRRRRLGRSLVELLVVLGIILLLVSFLAPAALQGDRAALRLGE
jgi:type II secretory pathway pseudopilin PulG